MALFSRSKDVKKEAPIALNVSKAATTDRNIHSILVKPHFTEKTVKMGEANVYTFLVKRDATKFQVRDAIKALYNVTPVKINIVNKKPALRLSGSKNRMVKVPGEKKAYVYLKKSDTINLV